MHSEVQISDVHLRLDPRQGNLPFEPLVESMRIAISPAGFEKIVRAGMARIAGKVPAEIELGSARLTDGGAEIIAKAKRSILKAEITVRLSFSAPNPDAIRVRIENLDAPAWMPTSFILDMGMGMLAGKTGLSRVPDDDRAFEVDPALILASRGIPAKLAQPGRWSVDPRASALEVAFESRA